MFLLFLFFYYSYEGLVVDDSEKKCLQDDFGDINYMFLFNYGGLIFGFIVGDVFMCFYDLQRVCEIQFVLMQFNEEVIEIL